MQNSTINYYNKNAEQYANSTYGLDLSDKYLDFLKNIKIGSKILDVGCGSGRDIKAFQEFGYQVEGLELSENLSLIAHKNTGAIIKNMSILDLNLENEYEGIWCMASLLHLKKEELPIALSKIADALKENGRFFTAFKFGSEESLDENGRFFSYYKIEELQEIFQKIDKFSNLIIQQSNDDKLQRENLSWINIYASKKELSPGLNFKF